MLPSHKEGVLYLEHCKLQVEDGRLSYAVAENAVEKFWSLPYAATACLLLGPGTSLTQAAARFLGSEGVLVGFVGGGGAPLYFASQNEYRPTKFMQGWCSFWFDPIRRLEVGKFFLRSRCAFVQRVYGKGVAPDVDWKVAGEDFAHAIEAATSVEQLLGSEAVFAKRMYTAWASEAGISFRREPRSHDEANRFLDHGNYLAYGLAAAVLWVMGISHSFAVLHGATRRGALVFDLADVVKDSCILPAAFIGASEKDSDSENRARCIAALDRHAALECMFSTIKEAIDVGCRR